MYFVTLRQWTPSQALNHSPVWSPWPLAYVAPRSHNAAAYLKPKACDILSLPDFQTVALDVCRNYFVAWKVRGVTELSHPTSNIWSAVQMFHVTVIAGSERMRKPEQPPLQMLASDFFFLLRLKHLEEVWCAMRCLYFSMCVWYFLTHHSHSVFIPLQNSRDYLKRAAVLRLSYWNILAHSSNGPGSVVLYHTSIIWLSNYS